MNPTIMSTPKKTPILSSPMDKGQRPKYNQALVERAQRQRSRLDLLTEADGYYALSINNINRLPNGYGVHRDFGMLCWMVTGRFTSLGQAAAKLDLTKGRICQILQQQLRQWSNEVAYTELFHLQGQRGGVLANAVVQLTSTTQLSAIGENVWIKHNHLTFIEAIKLISARLADLGHPLKVQVHRDPIPLNFLLPEFRSKTLAP